MTPFFIVMTRSFVPCGAGSEIQILSQGAVRRRAAEGGHRKGDRERAGNPNDAFLHRNDPLFHLVYDLLIMCNDQYGRPSVPPYYERTGSYVRHDRRERTGSEPDEAQEDPDVQERDRRRIPGFPSPERQEYPDYV